MSTELTSVPSANRLQRKFKLGLIINPFAGIGGALALKGSDGKAIREQALNAGAEQLAMQKTGVALGQIKGHESDIIVYTASGNMGEDVAKALGFQVEIVYTPQQQQTEETDTQKLAAVLLERDVDIILFAGGDGTARNLCSVLENKIPVLGIPAGCKIHSGVYAITPRAAGDLNEDAFRKGQVIARYFGEMQVPAELSYIQAVKMGGKESDEMVLADIAAYMIEMMEDDPDRLFVMGSGSTVAFIMSSLGLENTLLGVDVVQNMQLLASDVSAAQLLALSEDAPVSLVITLIGGQGHIFGRGNQQLSPELIARVGKQNIYVVATKAKLNALGQKGLICDTADEALNTYLSGPISVITGYRDKVLYFVRGELE